MIKQPDHRYLDYTITVQVWPQRSNRYGSSFSIRKGGDGVPTDELPLVYQEGHDIGMSCETADQANQDALERAYDWINAQRQAP